MPLKYALHHLKSGIEVVDVPDIKVSKYKFLTDTIEEANGKAIKVNRDIFDIGSTKPKIDGFIRNIQCYGKTNRAIEIEGMSQNGSIYFWKKG